jgi:hypothetical protein
MSETWTRDNGRKIELFVPIDYPLGKKTDVITIRPFKFKHVLEWRERKIKTALDLLASLTNLPREALREIGFPDFDRVMMCFLSMVPPEIQADIGRTEQDVMHAERPPAPPGTVPLSPLQSGPDAYQGDLPPSVVEQGNGRQGKEPRDFDLG